MPGRIIAVPFLDQIEDIENCLKNNKDIKHTTSNTFSYSNSNKNSTHNHNNNTSTVNNNTYNNSYNNYNYNNSYYYNKGNNSYYKKSTINGNKNFSVNGNNGNYDNYNKNFDYMRYNSRKNNSSNSPYAYNQQLTSIKAQDISGNDPATKSYPIYQHNEKDTDFNQAVAEQLKQTYPQIYQNTHSAVYSNGQTFSQADFALNQVTNNLGTLQLPDRPVQDTYSNQGQLGSNKYVNGHTPSNFRSESDINILMSHTGQNVTVDNNNNGNNNNNNNNNNEDNNMALFKSYIPSELLDSTNGTFAVNDGINRNLGPNDPNTSNTFVPQPQTSSLTPILGTNSIIAPPSNISDTALKFTSSPFSNSNIALNNMRSSGAQPTQKSDLSSIGWGSNQMDIQSSIPGRSSLNASSNSNSGMFGIWNNDMSVWS
ncbi:similar to Saccharomyces cerevisiae YBL081W Non-essential protein of unknown function [Maudiozyma saulgeensis]|uniref:Uncharacterized protein n=1 Tax=Maudiozyma saulgeensis TaxID=1789683 RepID=A0A1X7R4I7_9SACH|nr:similar to Saccharomyces cerevisiae YBL081W Non-essential protein of unknown function [Kazachstania saulgeensis]